MHAEKLSAACSDAIEYLRKYGDPHCTIVVTQNQVRLVRDEIGIPAEKAKAAE